jgi:hypothetical protein
MLLVTDEVPSFERELNGYCERQGVLPADAVAELQNIVQEKKNLTVLDKEIYGLRAAPLKARGDAHETVLLIDHENGHQRYVVYVSILDRPLENFLWPCREPVCKRKINIAIARLIMMSKCCGMGPGVIGI